MGLTSYRSAPDDVEEQEEEGVHDRKARGLALSKLAQDSCPPSGVFLYCSPKDKKYFEDRKMASSHSNIFNDSQVCLTSRVLVKPMTLPGYQTCLEVISRFRMNSTNMTLYLGFFMVWTIFLVNGIQAHQHEIKEDTHPRKNLGLAVKRSSIQSLHHHHKDQVQEPLTFEEPINDPKLHSKLQSKGFTSFRDRRKRHNKRHSKGVEYRQMTLEEEKEFQENRRRSAAFLEKSEDYEVEVKEAQNNSICDYKVIPIPDLEGNRIPQDLEHVVCNHAGSRCQDKGFYYCLQTYRIIDVYHGHERSKMKIYIGCVCALFDFPLVQPQSPRLPLDY